MLSLMCLLCCSTGPLNVRCRYTLTTITITAPLSAHTAASFFVLGKRMHCLPDPSLAPPDCQVLIEGVGNVFKSSQELVLSLPLYKLWATRPWRMLRDAIRSVNTVALSHVEQRLKEIRDEDLKHSAGTLEVPEKVDFLTYILHSGQMSLEDVVVNAVDLISGGVDTVRV